MRGPCSLLGLNYAVFTVKLIQSQKCPYRSSGVKHDQALGRTSSPITKRETAGGTETFTMGGSQFSP